MMSVGTAFAYIMGVCFLCSILGLVLINLCAVADFVINSRRGGASYIKELEREEDTSRYPMFLLVWDVSASRPDTGFHYLFQDRRKE